MKNNNQKGFDLKVQYIKLNEQLSLLCCNAELVQAYGLFIKQLAGNILPLGYSNGMIGYVPTQKQLAEGGYESVESIFYFGLPARLSSDNERNIQQAFKKILGGEH